MEFELDTIGVYYDLNDYDIEHIEDLKELGFKFTKKGDYFEKNKKILPKIEIKSIEELINFAKKYGEIMVSDKDFKITILDDYL